MFIISKRNIKIRRADGEVFRIAKEFVGNIPEDVAKHPLIQSAIACGWIATPDTGADKELIKADAKAAAKAAESDIRPDADKSPAEEEKPATEARKRGKK